MKILLISFLLLLSGCKVGPNYKRPATPLPSQYSEDRSNQTFVPLDSDLVRWWALFNDPCLDTLLNETLLGNFDLKIAVQAIFQTRAQFRVQFTDLFPEIYFDAQGTRYRRSLSFPGATSSTAVGPPTQNFFQTGFDAVWEIDLFGKIQRGATAALDIYQATTEDARDLSITLLSEVASTYMAIRAYQTKAAIAAQIVDMDEVLLELSQARFKSGLADEQEVETALAALEADCVSLKALETALKQTIYSLAVLTGRPPEGLLERFSTVEAVPAASGKIPLGVPADLLRRRHDVRSSERHLAAATEQIGVAVADLFPSINLTGSSSSYAANPLQGANIGYSSEQLRTLFNSASRIWGIGSLVVWPVFDFGNRIAAVDVQIFLRNQAYFAYQKTVISALQEVEQALVAYFNEECKQKSLRKEVEANKRTADLNLELYECGLANFTEVLQSREVWLNSLNALTDSDQALSIDLIAVYKALGGDWACI